MQAVTDPAEIEAWNARVRRRIPGAGRPPKYDWDAMTNGEFWEMAQGIDFACSMACFQTQLYGHARNRGMAAETRTRDGLIRFRFYKEAAN